ncbi:hypothetical protein ROHU_036083 [Labeo rohita]|uniref:Tc1-like transposase DDE domain-containing protein n=1 Tax=Labeo rohita TaxID=84645 RepID=A0A498NLK9_LABRO|nr:hypothetical protein ROHU_036083 [Labeo rohita]
MRMKQVYKVPFERNSPRVKELRAQYVQTIFDLESLDRPHDFIFVDEAGFNLTNRRRRGRNIIGQRAIVEVPGQRGGNVTICAAISNHGVLHHHVTLGPYNTQHLLRFIANLRDILFELQVQDHQGQELNENPIPTYVIVWDNVSFHRAAPLLVDCDPALTTKTWMILDSCLEISFPGFDSDELFCSTLDTTHVSLTKYPLTPATALLPAPESTFTLATAPVPAPEPTLTPATALLPAPEPTLTSATAPVPALEPTLTPATALLPAPEPTLTSATAPVPAPESTLTPATDLLPAPEPTLTSATAPVPALEPTLTPATALPAPEPTLTPSKAPPMRDPCGQKCRRKCTDKFNKERCKQIWNWYWDMELVLGHGTYRQTCIHIP